MIRVRLDRLLALGRLLGCFGSGVNYPRLGCFALLCGVPVLCLRGDAVRTLGPVLLHHFLSDGSNLLGWQEVVRYAHFSLEGLHCFIL